MPATMAGLSHGPAPIGDWYKKYGESGREVQGVPGYNFLVGLGSGNDPDTDRDPADFGIILSKI